MVRQRPWDEHEAVILLDAFIQVNEGNIERQKAISDVSKKLRQKAVVEGLEIDETYRNIAGITFQMYSMESAYCGYTIRKPATKLFVNVVSMMRNDYQRYKRLLKETEQMYAVVDNRTNYQNWLVNSGMQYKAARNYGNWLNNIDLYAQNNGYINLSIYELDDIDEVVELCNKLCAVPELQKQHRDWLTSLRKFVSFKSGGEIQLVRSRTSNDEAFAIYREEYQAWLIGAGLQENAARNYGNWLNNIAIYARKNGYCEGLLYEINDVDILLELYEVLNDDEELVTNHKDYLTSLRKYISFKSNGTVQLSKNRSVKKSVIQECHESGKDNHHDSIIKENFPDLYMKLQSMAKVYDDVAGFDILWIRNALDVNIEIGELKKIMDSLQWITEVDKDVYSFAKTAVKYEPSIDFNKDAFIKVLMIRYQNGMRFDSIDFENFRETYEDIIGYAIELTDRELEWCLRRCGVLYEGRIFPAEGIINIAAKEKLMMYIAESFSNGKQVLYYKAIYSDLSDVFAYCFNLTDAMMLKPYLEYVSADGEYFFAEEYMSKEANIKINHSAEIEEFLLAAGRPLSYEEIYAGLSHISRDVINSEIRTNSNIIFNEKEHYYHYGVFEFSSEDADKISGYISNDIEEEGYCIWSRVFVRIQQTMPLFVENNIYLSSIGIRNAISKKLSGRFDFDSEVICARGESLNMATVYKLYGQHHAPFSDEEIYEFAKEVSGKVIYFDALSETAVRTSKNLFVPRDGIKFDVDAVDNALSTYLSAGYMLIRDIDSFLVFPNVGYEWNAYLLESYLMYFSKKYSLVNNGQSLNNVAGALVRKGTGFDDFVNICADVLANSDVTLNKAKALDYLADQNLLTRRSYAKIEEAISKARQIRNKKG